MFEWDTKRGLNFCNYIQVCNPRVIVVVLLMLVWVIKYIRHSLTRTFRGIKIVFSCNFHDIGYAKFFITLLCGPILPYVQTVWEEARPNIIFIHTNRARKGPAQYPVWGQTNIRGQPAEEWIKLPSEERWSMLIKNWAASEDDGHFGTFVRGIWKTR